MQRSFNSRWTMSSAKLGGILWVAIAGLVFSGKAPLGVIELLFLLAPLVVVPLGFEVLDRHGGGLRPAALGRTVRLLQPLGAMLAVASFWIPPGLVAGALSSAWLAVGALTALMAVLDLLRPGWRALDRVVFNVARIDLAIAGCWLVTSRLGIAPMGFQEPIVLLTAVHFHYSGFATALIAGVTLKFCAQRGKSSVAAWIVGAAVFVPFLLAAGFVFSPPLRMICALILAVTLLGFSLLQFSGARDFTSAMARVLLRIAAGLLIPGMLLVMAYAIGEYTGNYWLVIPQMARLHGPLNGPGFVLLSLLAWVVEKSYRTHEVLRSEAEIFSGAAYFSDAGRTL
ncbi:MAG TPA: YndJ family protein [Terracidiphilus sp.]|nr:YndJ family protein [Terracidiphilus sp.]